MPVLRKELRALLPFIGLVLFICSLNVVDEVIGHQPDMRPMAETLHSYLALGEDYSVPLFLLAFALGVGLLAREHDEGTIEFLDSLPVSRGRVFVTKASLAGAVLLLLPLTNVVIAAILQFWSRTSIDPSFHWNVLLTSFFVESCQAIVFLALALALSFLRRFAWLAAGLLFWTYQFGIRVFPGLAVFNVFELTTPRFEGQRWMLPVDLLKVQLPLAAGLTAVAYFVYAGAGDRWSRAYFRMTRSRAGAAALVAVGSVAAALILTAVGIHAAKDKDEDSGDRKHVRVVYASWSTAHAETRYYSFTYPSNLNDRAQLVMARADEVHESVRKFLGASPDDTKIVVDMGGAAPHDAGNAYWKTIRMNLAASDNADRLAAVLGHETTHVYADRMSDTRLTSAFNSTRFFHEGLATYVENRLFGSDETVRPKRIVAAVMRSRHQVEFTELVDDALLRRKRDPNAVYPLGEVFVAALVDRYGSAAPGRLIEAFARKNAPKQLNGMELWRDVFQAAGFSLEATVDGFYAKLDNLVVQNREFIANLPRPRNAVLYGGGNIRVKFLDPPDDVWERQCRFRQFENSEERDFIWGNDNGSLCWVPRGKFPAATVWYQIGLVDKNGEIGIWEPWSEVRLP